MDQKLIIKARDVFIRPYQQDDIDAIYDLTQEKAVVEFLGDWNVSRHQRPDWLFHYEIPENDAFLETVGSGGKIESCALDWRLWSGALEGSWDGVVRELKKNCPLPIVKLSLLWVSAIVIAVTPLKLFGP